MHVNERTLATQHRTAYKPPMLTGRQIRAARALLGWTTKELSAESGVHYATLSRAEQFDGVPNVRTSTLLAVQNALEAGGVVFLDGQYSGDGGPGVRLKA